MKENQKWLFEEAEPDQEWLFEETKPNVKQITTQGKNPCGCPSCRARSVNIENVFYPTEHSNSIKNTMSF